jgi:hypothetical protein
MMSNRGLLVVVAAAGLLLFGAACENSVRSFSAGLIGAEVVPAVTTDAGGEAVVNLDASDTELGYKVTVTDISNATSCHIHLAPAGKTGEVVADLFVGPKKAGPFSGTLCEGSLRVADLKGPLSGKTMKAMISALRAGSTYVQVRTDLLPAGEIRGQLR